MRELHNNFKNVLFSDYQKELNYPAELATIETKFNVDTMVFVSEKLITECFNGPKNTKCDKSYEGLSDSLINYLETMQINREEEDNTTYYLVAEYREKSTNNGVEKCEQGDENCNAFYATLKLDINKKIVVSDALIGEACKGQKFADCIKDNYTLENDLESGSGIYHHDGNGDDSGYGEYEANDDSYRYAGGNPNNYICFGSDEEKCPEENLYRIIGVYGENIKIIKATDNAAKWNGLNTKEINYEEKWNNMIENAKWYVDSMSKDKIEKSAKEVHDAEISGTTENSKKGLIYVNEYMYGASPKYWVEKGTEYNKAKDNNWLYVGNEWMLTKVQGTTDQAYVVSDVGNVGSNIITQSLQARNSLYLKRTIILSGGLGTKEQPYRISDKGAIVKNITLAAKEGYFDLEVNVEAESQDGKILKYYFSIKKHSDDDSHWSEWIEDDDYNHFFDGLDSFTEYDIKAKVLNNRGNQSEEYVATFKTIYKEPEVNILGTTIGWYQVNADIKGENGTSKVGQYCYNLNGGSFSCENNSNLSINHLYNNLNQGTTYTIGVKVIDVLGVECLEAKYVTIKTDTPPTITASASTSEWTYSSVTVSSSSTGGTGSFHTEYCQGTDCTPSIRGTSMTNSSQGSSTICFGSRNDTTNEVSKQKDCASTYIDTTSPSISVSTSGTSVTTSCSDYESGVYRCSSCYPSGTVYSTTCKETLPKGNGYTSTVQDKAGNTTRSDPYNVGSSSGGGGGSQTCYYSVYKGNTIVSNSGGTNCLEIYSNKVVGSYFYTHCFKESYTTCSCDYYAKSC